MRMGLIAIAVALLGVATACGSIEQSLAQQRRHAAELNTLEVENQKLETQLAFQSKLRQEKYAAAEAVILNPVWTALKVVLMVLVGAVMVGGAYIGLEDLRSNTKTIRPNKSGEWPLIKHSFGDRGFVLFDPNLSPAATTVVELAENDAIVISPVDQPGLADSVAQRNTIRLLRDTSDGKPANRAGPSRVAFQPSPESVIPRAQILDIEPAHVERLLEDHGDDV